MGNMCSDAVNGCKSLAGEDFVRLTFICHAALVEQDHAIAPAGSQSEVVERHKNAATLTCEPAQCLHQHYLMSWIKARGGLVSDHERGCLRDRSRRQDTSLFAARKLRGDPACQMLGVGQFKGGFNCCAVRCTFAGAECPERHAARSRTVMRQPMVRVWGR